MQHGNASFLADCPARTAAEILSDKWSAVIVFGLRDGPMRHGALQERVGGISRKVLTETLRKLQDAGLVERTEDAGRRIDYSLTTLGRTLLHPIEVLNAWGSEHGAAVDDYREDAAGSTS